MLLQCLGSSSDGNCYLLRSSNEVLVIECGVPMHEVKKMLDFDISQIVGCIVSHQHNDHAKHIGEYLKCGINVYALSEVFEAKRCERNPFARQINPKHGYKVGSFKVYALPMKHDVPCLGFVIEHAEMGKLLFATDTITMPYKIAGLNHIMIEANYSDECLTRAIEEGITPASQRERLLGSHMELQTTINAIKANDIADVSEIILLHISARNAEGAPFICAVMQACGKPTLVAHKGFERDMSLMPY